MGRRKQKLSFSVSDISVSQYFALNEKEAIKYDIYINTLNPSSKFCGKYLDTSKLTYEQVELIRLTFKNPTIDDIKELFLMIWGIRGDIQRSADRMFMDESIFSLFRAKNYIQKFLIKLIEKEKKMLSAPPDVKSEAVNAGERLSPVNFILTKNRLAERFGCMPSDIAKMKYTEIFLTLLADKMYADVSNDYNQIK
jgi:hypothetical protein